MTQIPIYYLGLIDYIEILCRNLHFKYNYLLELLRINVYSTCIGSAYMNYLFLFLTQNVSEIDVDDAYDISHDDEGTSANTRESKQISSSNVTAEVTTLKYTGHSTLPYTQQPSPSSSSSLNRAATYPTECDPPTCGCQRYSSYNYQIIILATLLSVFRKAIMIQSITTRIIWIFE